MGRRQFEQTEIVQDTENFNVSESTFKSEKFEQEGFEKHHIESAQNTVETNINKEGPVFPVQPQPTESSSYSDSEPESPRSPSPKVSPTSKSPSQPDHDNHEESGESDGDESFHDNDLMKETGQELLDEMIVKDVPESESSTDPVKNLKKLSHQLVLNQSKKGILIQNNLELNLPRRTNKHGLFSTNDALQSPFVT